jgi:hypothetical protein
MGKYDPLMNYLINTGEQTVTVRFTEIGRIIGNDLPPSAFKFDQWWENDSSSPGRQCPRSVSEDRKTTANHTGALARCLHRPAVPDGDLHHRTVHQMNGVGPRTTPVGHRSIS